MLVIYILLLLLAFYALEVVCGNFFVPALDKIAERLKLPSDVAGATFMAVGSSAPELFTALFAVFHAGNISDVGAGTIVGSALFNILVIIGASALYKTAKLTWQPVLRDLLFYVISILALLFVFWDGKVELIEASAFLVIYVVYIIAVVFWKKILPYNDIDPIELVEKEEAKSKGLKLAVIRAFSVLLGDVTNNPRVYVWTFSASMLALAGLSYVLVEAAVGIGHELNINPTIIALTVLAAGTSIPDLLSSMIVAKQGRGDMAVSNAVGSNIFDILFGLGFPWVLFIVLYGREVTVQSENLISSVILLFATVAAILSILLLRRWKIGRWSGLVLIGLYLAYLVYVVASAV